MSEVIETMRKIADWAEEYNWTAHYNQKNTDGFPQFHSSPSSKPDLLLTNKNHNILVEVKPGHDHQDILDGYQQVLQYAGQYYTGRTTYYTNEKKESSIDIDAIVLATQYSLDGYLYGNESNTSCLNYSNEYLTQNKEMDEYPISHTVTRLLWRQWDDGYPEEYFRELRRRKADEQLKLPDKPKVGTLLAKIDYGTKQPSPEPHLFIDNDFVPMYHEEIYAFN